MYVCVCVCVRMSVCVCVCVCLKSNKILKFPQVYNSNNNNNDNNLKKKRKKKRTCWILDFTVPADYRMKIKEC